MGYAPGREALWTPAKTKRSTSHWMDPAFGQELDKTAPFALMHDPGDVADGEDDSLQVFRTEEPPHNVGDAIVILKAYANDLLEVNSPCTLVEL